MAVESMGAHRDESLEEALARLRELRPLPVVPRGTSRGHHRSRNGAGDAADLLAGAGIDADGVQQPVRRTCRVLRKHTDVLIDLLVLLGLCGACFVLGVQLGMSL